MNMMTQFNHNQKRMTSFEISELCQKRHDNVKRKIEMLVEQGVIAHPQIEDGIKSANGIIPKVYVFTGEQGKRDSIIVVAQLYPEFTARLVDRWQELEQRSAFDITNPAHLLQAIEVQAKLNIELSEKVAVLEPKAKGLDRIANSTNVLGIREAAKALQIGQNKLTQYLLDQKVIYRDQFGKIQAYQKSIDQKLVRVVTSAPRLFESGEKVFTQVKLTQKLVTRISAWLEKGEVA